MIVDGQVRWQLNCQPSDGFWELPLEQTVELLAKAHSLEEFRRMFVTRAKQLDRAGARKKPAA